MARVLTEETPQIEEPDNRVNDLIERARAFQALGFEAKPALLLALDHVSPSAARELLRKEGCTHDLAFRILL